MTFCLSSFRTESSTSVPPVHLRFVWHRPYSALNRLRGLRIFVDSVKPRVSCKREKASMNHTGQTTHTTPRFRHGHMYVHTGEGSEKEGLHNITYSPGPPTTSSSGSRRSEGPSESEGRNPHANKASPAPDGRSDLDTRTNRSRKSCT